MDEPAIKGIINKIKAETTSHIVEPQCLEIDKITKDNGICLVAQIEDVSIGFILATPIWADNPLTAHVCSVECYITEKFRNKTIGSQLMKKLLLEISKKGYKQIVNLILTGNVIGIAYTKRFGYREIGRLTNFLKLPTGIETVVVMEKILDRGQCNI